MNSHEHLMEISRRMHRRIGEKIRRNPLLLEIPRSNLKRWMQDESSQGWPPSPELREWERILRTYPVEDILKILEEDSEENDRLKHSSPFPGILSQEERSEFFRDEPVPA